MNLATKLTRKILNMYKNSTLNMSLNFYKDISCLRKSLHPDVELFLKVTYKELY